MVVSVFLVVCVALRLANGEVHDTRHDLPSEKYTKDTWRTNTLEVEPSLENESEDVGFQSSAMGANSWVNGIPSLPMLFATSNSLPDGPCKTQVKKFLKKLDESSLWAVQMFDASTKYPEGIIYGHRIHLGNFDQCFELRAQLSSDGESREDVVEGRYCLIGMQYRRENVTFSTQQVHTLDFDPNGSAWEVIDDNGDYRRVKRNSIYMALCVPATCSAADVEAALVEAVAKMGATRGLSIETTVAPPLCQARRDSPDYLTVGAKMFWCVESTDYLWHQHSPLYQNALILRDKISVIADFVPGIGLLQSGIAGLENVLQRGLLASLAFLVAGSSWYDRRFCSMEATTKEFGFEQLLLCFSAHRNIRSLLTTNFVQPGLDVIHAIRFFLTTLVIIGHRLILYASFPVTNPKHFEKLYYLPSGVTMFNCQNTIDGFLSLGGILLARGLLDKLDRRKQRTVATTILTRFFRTAPLHMLVVFFYATLLPQLDSGPLWKAYVEENSEHCVKNWWTNLLNINNYVNTERICLFQSWYLSADFQLYVMATMVIFVFWKVPRSLGYTILIGAVAVGMLTCFVVTYSANLQPFIITMPFVADLRSDAHFVNYYVKSHMRIAPYMIGVLTGAILHDNKSSARRLSKSWSRLLFVLVVPGSIVTCQLLGAKYYDPNYDYKLHPIETAAYAAFYRSAFALVTCAIVLLIAIGDGLQSLYDVLKSHWAPTLAKLSYGAYLLHNINQIYDVGAVRGSRYFSLRNSSLDLIVDLILAYGLSALTFIMIEQPLRRIADIMLNRRSKNIRRKGD